MEYIMQNYNDDDGDDLDVYDIHDVQDFESENALVHEDDFLTGKSRAKSKSTYKFKKRQCSKCGGKGHNIRSCKGKKDQETLIDESSDEEMAEYESENESSDNE